MNTNPTFPRFIVQEALGGFTAYLEAPPDLRAQYKGHGETVELALGDLMRNLAEGGDLEVKYWDRHGQWFEWPGEVDEALPF